MFIVYGKSIDNKDMINYISFWLTVYPVLLNFETKYVIINILTIIVIVWLNINIQKYLLKRLSPFIVYIFIDFATFYGRIKAWNVFTF